MRLRIRREPCWDGRCRMSNYAPDAQEHTRSTGSTTLSLPDVSPLVMLISMCPSSDPSLTCPSLPWKDDYMYPRIDILEEYYVFRNPRTVRDFIRDDSDIISALALAADAIRKYYPDAQLFLDVYRDHDDTGFELLALRIGTGLRHPETRRRLKMFRADWWNCKVSDKVDSRVVVGVEPGYANPTL